MEVTQHISPTVLVKTDTKVRWIQGENTNLLLNGEVSSLQKDWMRWNMYYSCLWKIPSLRFWGWGVSLYSLALTSHGMCHEALVWADSLQLRAISRKGFSYFLSCQHPKAGGVSASVLKVAYDWWHLLQVLETFKSLCGHIFPFILHIPLGVEFLVGVSLTLW